MRFRDVGEHIPRQIKRVLLAQRSEQIAEYEPTWSRESGRRLCLHEALHTSTQIRKRSFFFGEVRYRKQNRGVLRRCGQRSAEDDHLTRARNVVSGETVEIVVSDYQDITVVQSFERAIGTREPEQLRATNVRSAIATESEIFDAWKRNFFSSGRTECTGTAVSFHQLRKKKQRFVREIWRRD